MKSLLKVLLVFGVPLVGAYLVLGRDRFESGLGKAHSDIRRTVNLALEEFGIWEAMPFELDLAAVVFIGIAGACLFVLVRSLHRDDEGGEIVYVLKDPTNNELLKIGKTKQSLKRRVKQQNTGNPNDLICVHAARVPDCTEAETYLHRTFRDRQYNREWFKVNIGEVKRELKQFELENVTHQAK